MAGDRMTMSQRQRDVLKVMEGVLRGERTQVEAARLLGRTVCHVRRLQGRLEREGDGPVIHGLRGRMGAGVVPQRLRASEKLCERGLKVSADTLRRWLRVTGQFGYLASTASGERIYLHRRLVDADFVLPVTCLRHEPLLGCRLGSSVLFPDLAGDPMDRGALRSRGVCFAVCGELTSDR